MEDSTDSSSPLPENSEDAAKSPGLRAAKGAAPAFELKFELSQDHVFKMKSWALRLLKPDPHGVDGCYRVTSVYCDTPDFDVFHRSSGYRTGKLRLRRYDEMEAIFLERKVKRGDRIRKRRVEVAPGDLQRLVDGLDGRSPATDWAASWFVEHALKKQVAPTCRVGYRRTAYFGMSGRQAVRLTIDENMIGVPARGWEAPPLHEGHELLPGGALLELKFQDTMPELFRPLLPELPARTAGVSKYRRCVRLCGLVKDLTAPAAPQPGPVAPRGTAQCS